MIELNLAADTVVRLMGIWHERVEGGNRQPDSNVKLDSVPSRPGAVHAMDGSIVRVVYKAGEAPTARAIREASEAVDMGLPRRVYNGRLIDIKEGARGVYFIVRALERRSERTGTAAYRSFNPTLGQVLELTINPHEYATAQGTGRGVRSGR